MKQAQTGVTLIILMIAGLFIGAIVAGVYITNQHDFQARAKRTGDEVRSDVSAIFFVMDIIASDGTDGTVDIFRQLIKLPPGSEPVNLEFVNLVISTEDATASLSYAGTEALLRLGPEGFKTWIPYDLGALSNYYQRVSTVITSAPTTLNVDLDLDGLPDTVRVCQFPTTCTAAQDGRYLLFTLSSGPQITVPILDPEGGSVNIAAKDGEVYGNYLTPIGDYGYMSTSGVEVSGAYALEANTLSVFLAPPTFPEDLDADGQQDLIVINDTHIIVHYSSDGDVWQQFNDRTGRAYPLGVDLSGGPQTFTNVNITLAHPEANPDYGSILINGATSRASYIDADVTFLVTPRRVNQGVFAAEHVKRSENYQPGIIRDGDVVRLYYETPKPIPEDENVRVTLITRGGGVTPLNFFMPNIMRTQDVMVYPPR